MGGKPVLQYSLDALSDAGVSDIIVSTNAKFEDQVKVFLDSLPYDVDLLVEPTLSDGEKFGAVKAVWYAIEERGIKDDLIIMGGDNYAPGLDVKELVSEGGDAVMVVKDVGDESIAKKMGVVKIEGDRVVEVWEKPENPQSTLVSTFNQKLSKKVVEDYYPEYMGTSRNKDNMGCFYEWLVHEVVVKPCYLKGSWIDIGSQEALLRANREALNKAETSLEGEVRAETSGKVIIEGALVDGVVEGPSFIGGKSVVSEHCVVGPNAQVMSSVRVDTASKIRDSLVMSGAVIGKDCVVEGSIINNDSMIGDGARIIGSIIGQGVQVGEEVSIKDSKVYPFKKINSDLKGETVE